VIEDSATALLRGLCESFASFEGALRVDALSSRGWASVTFSGARHRVTFSLEGAGAAAAADAFLGRLEEAEFDLGGHILADIALVAEERSAAGAKVSVTLEALTVEDS
jgi:hypothetical protein